MFYLSLVSFCGVRVLVLQADERNNNTPQCQIVELKIVAIKHFFQYLFGKAFVLLSKGGFFYDPSK